MSRFQGENSVILVLTSLWVVKVEVLLDYYRDVWILVNEVVNETLRQNLTINLTTRKILLLNANYFFLTVSSTGFHKLTVTSFFFRSFKLFLSFEKTPQKMTQSSLKILVSLKKYVNLSFSYTIIPSQMSRGKEKTISTTCVHNEVAVKPVWPRFVLLYITILML